MGEKKEATTKVFMSNQHCSHTPPHHLCMSLQIFFQLDLLVADGLQRHLQLLHLRRNNNRID